MVVSNTMKLTSEEFHHLLSLFPCLTTQNTFAVGVSGGADSLALTLLLDEWARPQGKRIVALTVDHGLRPESGAEAQQVKAWLTARGITHETLVWEGLKPTTRLQETARDKRYALLNHWCQAHGITTLFTAHHALDQVETFLMRLAKGSGLRGLCAMWPCQKRPSITIVRPLLKIHPQQLRATLERFDQPFLEDPSNENTQFERIRWRKAWPSMGLSLEVVLETIDRLQETQVVIDEQLRTLATKALHISPYGYLQLDRAIFQAQSASLQRLFLGQIFQLFRMRRFSPKQEAVAHLHEQLASDRRVWTLGGCLIQRKSQHFLFFRELRAAEQCILHPNTTYAWDQRFLVRSPLKESVVLKPLGVEGAAQLSSDQQKSIPRHALITLPSLWQENRLIQCGVFDFPVDLHFRHSVLWSDT